ncbi:hypothetical protein [Dyadobacter psychrotolerans]|uniref:Uncharacterized protein n=1 Tax=Dyadobacter psychrotolerans TaxID=2541721 RepID=A0A4R5DV82_9BACT|nr:hypothetical protein [Dyadobacter psychrotolerans]TDE17737.1 hypothetical protein E0F88_07550 [Dyadobacter psychrotolerans]
MTKNYIIAILLALFIGTLPLSYVEGKRRVRIAIAETVTQWPEAQASYSVKERDQIENVLAVAMPQFKDITE